MKNEKMEIHRQREKNEINKYNPVHYFRFSGYNEMDKEEICENPPEDMNGYPVQ